MKVWILQTGEPLHIDDPKLRPMRAMNLSDVLAKQGHEVWLISSDFDHFSKTHRNRSNQIIKINSNLNLWLIKSRGYKKHIGIQRMIDHAELGFQLRKLYSKLPIPDVVFIGYPPIETAWSLSRWLKKKGIPYFVDAKDAWPDIFVQKFPSKLRTLAKLAFSPYSKLAHQIFRDAKGVVGPSEEFLNWGLRKARRNMGDYDLVAPLTSQSINPTSQEIMTAEDFWREKGLGDHKLPVIFFVGSLTNSFNFEPLIDAAKSERLTVVIAGEGPLKDTLASNAKNLPNLIIPGWIDQIQLLILSKQSKFSLLPLIDRLDFNMGINNKLIDSLRLGMPILCSNKEMVRKLIIPLGIGAGYNSTNLLETCESLLENKATYSVMHERAMIVYEEQFEFNKVYGKLALILKKAV